MNTAEKQFSLNRAASKKQIPTNCPQRRSTLRDFGVIAVSLLMGCTQSSHAANNRWDTRFGGAGMGGAAVMIVSGTNIYMGGYGISKWNLIDGWARLGLGGGVDGTVNAIAVAANGDVYVGGRFQTAHTSDLDWVFANNVAKWNGSAWSALGDGVGSYSDSYSSVYAIGVNGSDVYVGGTFTNAGTLKVSNLARWNAAGGWSALGGGATGYSYPYTKVRAITVNGSDVYVGGSFTNVGGMDANNIAKFTGGNWSALGTGVGYPGYPYQGVRAIGVSAGEVYAVGDYDQGSGPHYISKWNGTSWSALGGGLSSSATALAFNGADLYVANYAMPKKWDGYTWSDVGVGVQGGSIGSMAIMDNILYVAGSFDMAGGVPASGLARTTLPATGWSAVGGGVNNAVRVIAARNRDLYVGGDFDMAGGTAVNHLARWDGKNWSAVGSGMGYIQGVSTIDLSGDEIYAGGGNGVQKCVGGQWSVLGSTSGGGVNAVSIGGDGIYAGGWFSGIGGITASNIAKWNGTNWSALGNGPGGWVHTLEGGVGGSFGVSTWNGTNWLPLGGTPLDGSVYQIVANGGDTYVGGSLRNKYCCSPPFCDFFCYNYNFFKWDGFTRTWSYPGYGGSSDVIMALKARAGCIYIGGYRSVGSELIGTLSRWDSYKGMVDLGGAPNDPVYAIEFVGSDMYVGGAFGGIGGTNLSYIAKLDTSSWSAFDDGLNGDVWAIAVQGSDVYAAGSFSNIVMRGIARWDGHVWSPLGDGMDGVTALAVSGSDVYAGNFGGIFRWDGHSWRRPPGAGAVGSVYAVAVSGSDVYVGGDFSAALGVSMTNIVRWNGSTWLPLGSGVHGIVRAIAVNGRDVYVGGNFTMAGDVAVNYIAKWDGTNWSPLGAGFGGPVNAIAVSETNVYVGGNGGVSRWNGSTWSALGQGVQEIVNTLAANGSELYVGGRFNRAYQASGTWIQVNKIARWDGTNWSALDGGVDSGTFTNVWTIAIGGTNVYVGGQFGNAGGKPSSHFARWTGATLSSPRLKAIEVVGRTNVLISFSPTPGLLNDVQVLGDLGTGVWISAATNITGLGGVIQWLDAAGSLSGKRFYRVSAHY